MHVIIIGTAYPYRGGLAAYSERLARQYILEGNEVEIITFTLQYPAILFPGKTQFSSEPQPDDLKITRMVNSLDPRSWVRTGRAIRKKAPDRLIFCYWMAFIAPAFGTIARFARNHKTRMIGLIHNMIPHEPTLLDRIFPGYFVKQMDGFVAMADAVAADIENFDKKHKPKAVSPHPMYDHYGEKTTRSQAAQHLELNEQLQYVLFFGFIRYYKGLDLLIEAFADERLRQFPLKLIIAGEFYENPDEYLRLIHDLHLDGVVELHNHFIDDPEVKLYFSLADIVAQPYRSATQSGVSQIAYHYDTPMLVTDVGGLAEIVPHGKVGYVVEVNKQKIADALYDFFLHQRGDEFRANILEEKKKYEWSTMTATLNSI